MTRSGLAKVGAPSTSSVRHARAVLVDAPVATLAWRHTVTTVLLGPGDLESVAERGHPDVRVLDAPSGGRSASDAG